MGRIRADRESMKIEHWQSHTRFPKKQLRYHNNLLGACQGGDGLPRELQHCDTRKGDLDLRWNPAEPAHHIETRVRYEADGSIRSDDSVFDSQLDDVLNLNVAELKNSRRGVWDAIVEWLKIEKARLKGPIPRATFARQRARQAGREGDLEPYCQVAVWWLDRRLAAMPT
jgi:hypothetical protein